jgi:hypothetical protein
MRVAQPFRRSALVAVAFALLASCSDDGGAASDTAAGTVAPVVTAGDETTVAPPTDVAVTDVPTTEAAAVATISGTAYTFNTPDPIVGATITVVEAPGVSTVTAADGSYSLELPAGGEATLYIEAEGHFGIHTQTFTLTEHGDGLAIEGVNFQTPTLPIYDGLKALVGGFTGKDPFEGEGCVIVTTVGDARMVLMTFDEFIDFHPHGVEGATVSIEPPLATPIYFNEDVLPDSTQLTTSIDGGVLWPNVPPGQYTLTAQKDGTEFVTVHAICQAGWVVNANPVHGLHAIP